jgi:hypothetical protein
MNLELSGKKIKVKEEKSSKAIKAKVTFSISQKIKNPDKKGFN